MSNHASRALRATVAAAGAATLGLSFVGTATAADTPNTPNVGDQTGSPSSGSSDPSSMLSHDSEGTPSVDSSLLTFEMPRVESASYNTPLDGYRTSKDDNGCSDSDDSNHSGSDPVQYQSQCRDNSFLKGNAQIAGHTI